MFQTWGSIKIASRIGCELCQLIMKSHNDSEQDDPDELSSIFCNVWNYYEGDIERYKGSASIIFSEPGWSVKLGIVVDESTWRILCAIGTALIDNRIDSPPAQAKLISGRRRQDSANSEDCFRLVSVWMNECITEHADSCPRESSSMPTRVLDVSTSDGSNPFLLETEGLDLDCPWIALSHCWGRGPTFQTTSQNKTERTRGIPFQDMPLSFQDAVKVTRKLKHQYLWIDCLCILQDIEQDWAHEAAKMHQYYKHAVLTINADAASGDSEGFLNHDRVSEYCIEIPFVANNRLNGPSSAWIREHTRDGQYREQSHLTSRAWALAEYMLSPRTLHFTSEQLVWECQKYKLIETDETPLGTTEGDLTALSKRYFLKPNACQNDPFFLKYPVLKEYLGTLHRWYQILENYSQRNLTLDKDRLPALASLAHEIQEQSGMTYRAGIWVEDFLRGLLWSIDGRGDQPSPAYYNGYRAPTWSWASLNINTAWGNYLYPTFELYGRLHSWKLDTNYSNAKWLGYSVRTLSAEPSIHPVDGYLQLEGLWLDYNKWKGVQRPSFNVYWLRVRSHLHRSFNLPWILGAESEDQLICSFDRDLPDDFEITEALEWTTEQTVSNDDGAQNNELVIDSSDPVTENALHEWDEAILRHMKLFQIARYTITMEGKLDNAIIYALMLRPAGKPNTYRRVGLAEVPDINGLARTGWENVSVTLI